MTGDGGGTPGPEKKQLHAVPLFLVVTAATTAVCVAGEAAGNLIFRGGEGLSGQLTGAAVFGVCAGGILSVWLWMGRRRGA